MISCLPLLLQVVLLAMLPLLVVFVSRWRVVVAFVAKPLASLVVLFVTHRLVRRLSQPCCCLRCYVAVARRLRCYVAVATLPLSLRCFRRLPLSSSLVIFESSVANASVASLVAVAVAVNVDVDVVVTSIVVVIVYVLCCHQ